MRSKFLVTWGLFLLPFMAMASSAVDMNGAMLHAWKNNPSLLSARANLKAVKQNIPIARSRFLPQINGQAGIQSNFRNGQALGGANDSGRYSSSTGVELSQSILNISDRYNLSGAKIGVEAEKERLRLTEQQLLLDVVTKYTDVARDAAIYRLRVQYEKLLSRQYTAVHAQIDAGELSATDQYLSEANWRGATAAKVAALANLNISKASFLQISGLEAKNMAPSYIPKNLPKKLSLAQTEAISNNVLILISKQNLEQNIERLKQAKAERFPTVSTNVNAQYLDDLGGYGDGMGYDGTDVSVNLKVSVPLFQGGRINSSIEAARENVISVEKGLLDTQNSVRQQVTATWEGYLSAKQQVSAYRSQIKASEISAKGALQEFQSGTRSLIDLIDEDARLVDARINFETAQAQKVIAAWVLLQTTGRLTPRILGVKVDG